MKRTKKIMALLLAAAMSVGQVPAVVLADTVNATAATGKTVGVLGTDTGKITVANARKGETYSVYRLFELASFADENTTTSNHGTNDQDEAYSYVINSNNNPWYTFLTTYGPQGVFTGSASTTNYKYAVLSTETDATLKENAYFVIDADAITIKGADNNDVTSYHVITPTDKFSNAWDLPNSGSVATDSDGSPQDGNIMSDTAGQNSDKKYGVIQRFAEEALKYAETPANNVVQAGPNVEASADGSTDLLSEAPLGYYLVGTTMGTLASLDTTNKDVAIYEKNDEPEIDKTVLKKGSATSKTAGCLVDNTGDVWVDNTDADIGDYVQFRTVVTAQQGAKNYEIHDVVESGLTYVKSNTTPVSSTSQDRYTGYNDTNYMTEVFFYHDSKLYEVPQSVASPQVVNYTLTEQNTSDNCTFEILFSDADGATPSNLVQFYAREVGSSGEYSYVDIQDGDKIIVTYWAQVNARAQVFDDTETEGDDTAIKDTSENLIESQIKNHNSDKRNTNSTILTYGNKSYTRWDDATVTTYQFDVVKTDDYTGNTKSLLGDAVFSLYKASVVEANEDYTLNSVKYKRGANALVFKTGSDNEYYFAGDSITSAGGGQVNQLTSKIDHEIHLEGLEAGTYLLVEDTAPAGYNKLAHPVVVTITGGSDINKTATPAQNEATITSVFSPNSGAAATTVTNAKWDAAITSGTPATYTANSEGQGGLQIVNQTGQELPSTGGIGTTIFYVAGGILLTGSIIALITKRRMATES